ncbi:MAG: MFS transporter, partial [Nocardioidaceae bacterium]
SQLASFAMLQLLVYAAMQIPVGLMLDRFGPRRILLAGVTTLTAAQVGFAFADTYATALAARIFVGVGDAMVFVCVLRLVTTWFAPRQIPLVTQLTGLTGQLGAIAAAVPMTFALHALGWTEAYVLTASIGVVLAVALLAVVHDTPEMRVSPGPRFVASEVTQALRASWSHPGTRLGFWTHFTAQFGPTVLGLLWGYPFFVVGQGVSPAAAGLLLTALTLATMASGPVVGWMVANRPFHRSTMVLGIVASIVGVWTAVLVWPGDAPLPLLFLLVLVVGIGGPGSMVAFDFVRSFNPPSRLGSATGVVNQGGFIASLITVVAIGLVLDLRTPAGSGDYSASAFTWAMSVQYVLWAVGSVQIWRYRRRVRSVMQSEDPAGFAAMRAGALANA